MSIFDSNIVDQQLMLGEDARIDEEIVKISRGPVSLQEKDKIQQLLWGGRAWCTTEQLWDCKASIKCHDLHVNEIDEIIERSR